MKPLIAAVTALYVVALAAGAYFLTRDGGSGKAAFAGSYPLVKAQPKPGLTWKASGPPAGPLPKFHGKASKAAGRITDKASGISYVRFAPPWHPHTPGGQHTAAQEIQPKKSHGMNDFWYVAVYSGPLARDMAAAATGPDALRAAAELYAADFLKLLYEDEGRRTDLAGAPLKVDGHAGWVTAFRMTHTDHEKRPDKWQTEVVVAVDTGRKTPAIVEITIPSNKAALLPDVNAVVSSLRVVR